MSRDRQGLQSGTAAALKTIYPPELAAQADFDRLLERMKAPVKSGGDNVRTTDG